MFFVNVAVPKQKVFVLKKDCRDRIIFMSLVQRLSKRYYKHVIYYDDFMIYTYT